MTAPSKHARRPQFIPAAVVLGISLCAIAVEWMAIRQVKSASAAAGKRMLSVASAATKEDLQNLHEASMAEYRLALDDFDQPGKWNVGVMHLARALKWEPANRFASARLWGTLAAHANPARTVLRHQLAVEEAIFSPDGAKLLTVTAAGAQLWDSATGKPLGEPIRHLSPIFRAAFSPDGTRIVTASEDHTARLWNAASGLPLGEALRHEGPVNDAAFSPDGTKIVTASDDQTARLWDAATGAPFAAPLRHEARVSSAEFSSDGTRIVTAADKVARVWDTATGRPLSKPLLHDEFILGAVFSPDGTKIVTAGGGFAAYVWNVATSQPFGEPLQHEGGVMNAVFSPDGTAILTASLDNTARLWEAATGKPLHEPQRHEGGVNSAEFSPDGARFVTSSFDGTARVWETATGKPVGEPLRHTDLVRRAVFSPDGTRIATASWDKTARIWDVTTNQPQGEPLRSAGLGETHGNEALGLSPRPESSILSQAFSRDGSKILIVFDDHTARVWDAATRRALGEPLRHDDAINTAMFSPDGRKVVTASSDKTARIWDSATGKPLGVPLPHDDSVNTAVFSPDGTRIVTASNDQTARVWSVATGQPIGPPILCEGPVECADFSVGGAKVLTSCGIKTAQLWDTVPRQRPNQPRRGSTNLTRVAFNFDGRKILIWGIFGASVWDAASGHPFSERVGRKDWLTSAEFSADGTKFVIAGGDHFARICDAFTGEELGEPLRIEDDAEILPPSDSNDGRYASAVFSPDGTIVVTGSELGPPRIWRIGTETHLPKVAPKWTQEFCSAITGLRYNPNGTLIPVSPDEQTATLSVKHDEADPWSRLFRWIMTPQAERPIQPDSKLTLREIAEQERDSISGLESAIAYDPSVPLTHLMAAGIEQDPHRAAFLRRYDLQRLPAGDSSLFRRAVEILRQQDPALARDYLDRVLKLRPTDVTALKLQAELNGR